MIETDINVQLSDLFKGIQKRLSTSSKVISKGLAETVKNHFRTIYPSSSHYDPQKVTEDTTLSQGSTGVINVDVPGITRAYHDIDIRPKFKKSLTIPLHQSAYGKKAPSFDDLFVVKTKNGKAFLAQNNGGNLTMMYLLTKHVHQRQDTRLMPDDDTLAINVMSRISRILRDIKI